jgi:U3 small nucleolar RNA-associated protein 11
MSSLKNIVKVRTYKERGQLQSRAKLGLLEKHKDYQKRAKDHHRKEKALLALREKANQRNPDEFYHQMISSKMVNGRHSAEDGRKYTADELKLMKSQDLQYINMKIASEKAAVEKIAPTSVSLLPQADVDEERPQGSKHTIFVDSRKEREDFDAAEYFDTHPSLLGRKFNRPKMEDLTDSSFIKVKADKVDFDGIAKEREKTYQQSVVHLRRLEKLKNVEAEMSLKKHLSQKGKRKFVGKDPKTDRPIYKWKKERKS